jgi:hypothetical protein
LDFNKIIAYITASSDEVPSEILGAAKLSPQDSLRIYRSDYSARMLSVLGNHFPMTWKVLGDEMFLKLTQDYLKLHPSQHWDINCFGHLFPTFLKERLAHISASAPQPIFSLIPDLAQLEWASHEYFHAPHPLTTNLELRPGEMQIPQLRLSPYLHFFASAYQVPTIYREAQRETSEFPSDWEQPSFYFLWKKDFAVQLEDLSQNQFYLLKEWRQHGTFAQLIERLEALDEATAEALVSEISPLLARLLETGFLVLN